MKGAATNLCLAELDLHGLRIGGRPLQESDVLLIRDLFKAGSALRSLFEFGDAGHNPTNLTEITLAANGFTPQAVQRFVCAVGYGQRYHPPRGGLDPNVQVGRRQLRVIDVAGIDMTPDLDALLLQMVRAMPTLEVLGPYSSDEAPSTTGAQIIHQLDLHCMPAHGAQALAMAECLLGPAYSA